LGNYAKRQTNKKRNTPRKVTNVRALILRNGSSNGARLAAPAAQQAAQTSRCLNAESTRRFASTQTETFGFLFDDESGDSKHTTAEGSR
jgi:hypothetical protein